MNNIMADITALCKRRGFIYPGSEIYGGLRGFWDYGPMGVELKNNIKREWWKSMVYSRDDVVGVDAAIIMKPEVWEGAVGEDNAQRTRLDNPAMTEIIKSVHWRAVASLNAFINMESTVFSCALTRQDFLKQNFFKLAKPVSVLVEIIGNVARSLQLIESAMTLRSKDLMNIKLNILVGFNP